MSSFFLADFFTNFIYQPFLNLLVLIYWFLGFFAEAAPDMGVAVIILTVIIRLLLLPLSLAGTKSEAERRDIAEKVLELEQRYKEDRDGFRRARKKLFARRRPVLIGESFSLLIQITIAVMLWQMFETGLPGKDLHLIYPFMPQVDTPFNLMFLGRFDLSHTSLTLNFVQSLLIFVFETVAVLTSPYPPSRGEIVRLQLTLPIVSFIIFMGLPAGKKLFVITTLIFSIILTIVRYIYLRFMAYKAKFEQQENEAEMGENKPSDPHQEKLVQEYN